MAHGKTGIETSSELPPTPQRVWNRQFVMLLIIDFITILGSFMVRPIVSNYALDLGATFTVAGIVGGMAYAAATILRPITGYFSDTLNKKTSFLIAAAASAFSAFGCALSQSAVLLGVFVAISGISLSFQAIGLTALVALSVPRERIGTAVGWTGIIMNVTMAIGPAAAAAVSDWSGYRASFIAGGIFCCIGFVLIALFKAPPGAEGTKLESDRLKSESLIKHLVKKAFHVPTIPIAIVALLTVWSGTSLSILMFTVEETGYMGYATIYFLLYAIIGLGSRPIAGWLSDRVHTPLIAVPLLAIGMLGMLVPVFAQSLTAVIVCGVCMGLGQASAISVVMAESVRGVDNDHLGRATNTYFMGVDLGGVLSSWVGGLLIQIGSPALLFGFNAFTCFAAAALLIALRIAKKRRC